MNRSVILYLEQQNLEEGVLGGVKDHLKKHWGKYALGAAAIGTGGALLANPALATTAGNFAGNLATKAGNAVGLQNAGQAVGNALKSSGQAVTTGAQAVRTVAGNTVNSIRNKLTKGYGHRTAPTVTNSSSPLQTTSIQPKPMPQPFDPVNHYMVK